MDHLQVVWEALVVNTEKLFHFINFLFNWSICINLNKLQFFWAFAKPCKYTYQINFALTRQIYCLQKWFCIFHTRHNVKINTKKNETSTKISINNITSYVDTFTYISIQLPSYQAWIKPYIFWHAHHRGGFKCDISHLHLILITE